MISFPFFSKYNNNLLDDPPKKYERQTIGKLKNVNTHNNDINNAMIRYVEYNFPSLRLLLMMLYYKKWKIMAKSLVLKNELIIIKCISKLRKYSGAKCESLNLCFKFLSVFFALRWMYSLDRWEIIKYYFNWKKYEPFGEIAR